MPAWIIGRAFVIWLLLILLETINGTLRVLWIEPVLGAVRARQIGVVWGSVVILLIAWLTIRWISGGRRPFPLDWAAIIGFVWLVLTLTFELGLGRLTGRTWPAILSDFDLTRGGWLSIGMLILALAPVIAVRLRGLHRD
jgi:hypothetical protein